MSTVERPRTSLETGDNLNQADFMRIWEQLPNLKRAELINGIVYMPSPVGRKHAAMHLAISEWVSAYRRVTPGCAGSASGTWLMLESALQPDIALWLLPEFGGQSQDEGNYSSGAPELVIELASSTVAYDLHQKLKLYCDAGVQEYLVVILGKREIRWHRRAENRYEVLAADAGGIFHSQIFPGLWLNSTALLSDDINAVMTTLQEGLRSPEHAEFIATLQAKRAQ